MANKKITALTAITALDVADVLPVADVSIPETKKITAANLWLGGFNAHKDIDGTFAANSDLVFPTQKAVKTYVDTTSAAVISNTAYDATSWNNVTTIAPSKDSVRDKIESLSSTISTIEYEWTALTAFTATPASTSTITTTSDLSSVIVPGTPLKYVISSTTYYGICTAITTDTITIAGAPLSTTISSLYYGNKSRVRQLDIVVNGFYEDASNTTLIATDVGGQLVWNMGTAYCVMFKAYSRINDGSNDGTVQVTVGGNDVCSTAAGLTLAADATWYTTVVDITPANCETAYGEVIELDVTKGTGGDAQDLSVSMVFVLT